jgi:hypothetical protein
VVSKPIGVHFDLYIQLGGRDLRLAGSHDTTVQLEHAGLAEELHVLENRLRVEVVLEFHRVLLRFRGLNENELKFSVDGTQVFER